MRPRNTGVRFCRDWYLHGTVWNWALWENRQRTRCWVHHCEYRNLMHRDIYESKHRWQKKVVRTKESWPSHRAGATKDQMTTRAATKLTGWAPELLERVQVSYPQRRKGCFQMIQSMGWEFPSSGTQIKYGNGEQRGRVFLIGSNLGDPWYKSLWLENLSTQLKTYPWTE